MSTKKSSKTTTTTKKDKAKKGAKQKVQGTIEKVQATTPVETAVESQTQTTGEPTPAEAQAEVVAAVQPATTETHAEAPAGVTTVLVWPEQPTTQEIDLATYHMWTTACSRYRVYRSLARLTGGTHHFNAEAKNGDGGYHSIEQAKDGCGRPRDYRTLDAAVEVCRLHFAGSQTGATSDETAMFAYAQANGLDVLPAVSSEAQADAANATPGEKKRTRKPKAEGGSTGKMSAIDAAAKVLSEAGKPMNTKEMIEQMAAKGLWKSPGGQTPAATLYSAILREMKVRGADARFKKADRGQFAFNAKA